MKGERKMEGERERENEKERDGGEILRDQQDHLLFNLPEDMK